MTLDELIARESIRDTIALASQAGDALDFEAYAACFTPDGVLTFGDWASEGRGAIRAQMEQGAVAKQAAGVTTLRHNVTSTVIRLAGPDRAEVRSYFMVNGHDGLDHYGRYEDVFAVHDDRWLIERRQVSLDWISPLSRHARGGR